MIQYVNYHELETKRLLLRKQTWDDTEDMHNKLLSDPDVGRYMLWHPTSDLNVTRGNMERFMHMYENPYFYRWILEKKDTHELIGLIQMVRLDDETNTSEFAYMLAKEYWNHGYMTEALKRLFTFGFEELKLEVIKGDHFIENPASGHVMQKAGMRYTGDIEDTTGNDKGYKMLSHYEITRDEFYCNRE